MTTYKEPTSATQAADRIDALIKDIKRLAAHCAVLEDALMLDDYEAASVSFAELPEHLQHAIDARLSSDDQK